MESDETYTHTDGLINDQNSSFYFVFLHTLGKKKTHQTDTYNTQKDVVRFAKKTFFIISHKVNNVSEKRKKKDLIKKNWMNRPIYQIFFLVSFPFHYSFFIIND